MEDRLFQWLDIRLSKDAADEISETFEAEDLLEDAVRADRCLELLEKAWPTEAKPTVATSPAADSAVEGLLSLSESMEEFGRFKIRRLLGYGGMGVVFLAHDPLIQRDVALKIPHGGTLVTRQAKARFLREAQVAGILRHPNIVRVLETGEVKGVCFIASEYWEGPTLSRWIEECGGPVMDVAQARVKRRDRTWEIPSRQAVRICISLAEALQHAHDREAVHRDLKPSNVLLTEEKQRQPDAAKNEQKDRADESDDPAAPQFVSAPEQSQAICWQPRITDFGLATLNDNDMSLTVTGATLGTAEYMPPEQACGDPTRIGPAADQYALGIVLYQLLTGVSPFRRESLTQTLIATQQDPTPSLTEFRPELSRDLEAICLKAVAKEPQQRYNSAGELADDLQRFIDNKPILARPISVWERGWRWAQRNPGLASTVSALAVAILMVVAVIVRSNMLLFDANEDLAASLERANQLQQDADASRRAAETQARLAADREVAARQIAYLSDMKLAARAAAESRWIEVAKLLERHVPGEGVEDVRNIEWHALDHQVRERIQGFGRHPGAVNEICLFPDGQRVATACEDGCVRIWRLSDPRDKWKPELVIPALKRGLHAVAVSPDGETVASAGPSWMPGYTALTLWDVDTGALKQSLHRHATTIEAIQFSPDGDRIASAARNDVCRVWDFKRNRSVAMKRTREWVRDLAFVDDLHLVCISEGRVLSTFDTNTGEAEKSREVARYSTLWLSGKVAISYHANWLSFLDLNTHQEIGALQMPHDVVRRIDAGENGVLAIAMRDGNVQCWQMSRKKDKLSYEIICDNFVHRGGVRDVEVLDDKVVSGSIDGTVVVSSCRLQRQANASNGVTEAVLFDGGARMLSSDMSGRLVHHTYHSPDDNAERAPGVARIVVAQNESPATCLAISRSQRFASVALENGEVLLIDLLKPNLTPLRMNTLDHEMYFMPVVCAVGDDGIVYTSNDGLKVGVWDLRKQQRVKTIPLGSFCRDLTLTHDNRFLISGQDDIQVFRTDDYSLVQKFSGSNIVKGLAVRPGDSEFVSAHEDGVCRVWDMETFELKRLLPAQQEEAVDVHYNDSGDRILTCTHEGIWIWDADSGDNLGLLASTEDLGQISLSGDRLIEVADERSLRSRTRWRPLAWNAPSLPEIAHPTPESETGRMIFSSASERRVDRKWRVNWLRFQDEQRVWFADGLEMVLWNVEGGVEQRTKTPSIASVDGPTPTLALSLTNNRVALVDLKRKQERWNKEVHSPNAWVQGVVTGEGEGSVLLTDRDGHLMAVDAQSGAERWDIRRPESGMHVLPWGKDKVVWGGKFPYVAIYDSANGRKMHEVFTLSHAHRFACDDNFLVSGHSDGTLRLWALIDGRLRMQRTFAGHVSEIRSLDLRNGMLLSVSSDSARVWDLARALPSCVVQPDARQSFVAGALSRDARYAAVSQTGVKNRVGYIEVGR